MIRKFASTLLISLTLVGAAATVFVVAAATVFVVAAAAPAAAQGQRPDTDFCAKMRAKDPGGICTPKGEYVTAEKVYLPDGRIINRTTGG
jgi:hypothetical protein